ncbi:uncharacterized protein PHALS_04433 [Plasmopara halstedii]|uniref:Uncharacterized protein n=1 Tax=Plasmopara halstedii TaxID=4781 RepID=A0A0P1AZ15_PLAHL|nr:uncharacterized protein PHALS_04433 [Plasmopara halstedii]CEG47565.1 hypothetical protein PHALS_04433 [Plasmopara halstedii]|eukprot:XP_024583934.1 hypothetical protein PHALS_04433 [Plasmopara halstedii]
MLRERNTFVLKARSDVGALQHALTLQVSIRSQDLTHFHGDNDSDVTGRKTMQRLLEMLDGDEAFQLLVREMNDLRQLDQLVKTKSKECVHTLQSPEITVQWQVVEEPGLPSVLLRAHGNNCSDHPKSSHLPDTITKTGKYRPLPVRKLVVAVWIYPPHVELPPTGDRIPVVNDAIKQDFFETDADDDGK